MVPDPSFALHSRDSEFIENRHWFFSADLLGALPELGAGESARLRFESLDGCGEIRINGEIVAEFDNTFLPVEVELTHLLQAGTLDLDVIFLTPPPDLGQVGWTSRGRDWKPRFNYGWDWTPRIVQIGIARHAFLKVAQATRIERCIVRSEFTAAPRTLSVNAGTDASGTTGTVHAAIDIVNAHDGDTVLVHVERGSQVFETRSTAVAPGGSVTVALELPGVKPWSLDGADQPLYRVDIELIDPSDHVLDSRAVTTGFRTVSWGAADGARVDAEPWICHVNGHALFMQGINWVPIRPDYADVADEEYRIRLELYKKLGVNLIRVWGGAPLERQTFYDLCDELGILVWQELPLSSSGIDNCPPDDDAFAEQFGMIARHYVEQIAHHPCLAVWCGGNELAGVRDEPNPPGKPLDFGHPALAVAKRVFESLDPGRKVVPTSPSGPEFGPAIGGPRADPDRYDDVHGPWADTGDEASWAEYWSQDTSLLRSEVGMVGATDADILEHYGLMPDSDEDRATIWAHSSAWWLSPDDNGTPTSIARSQLRQARLLSIAARASKGRFPACAGFVVWMGHDTFPCPVSLSIVDYWGRPKPAALALAEIFTS